MNIGMWPGCLRVGLGFQIGRQVSPKMPALQIFQTFLGARPPLPFRDAFYRSVERNGFDIELKAERKTTKDADEVLHQLETFVVPADDSPVFAFVGALWEASQAETKGAEKFRGVFRELMPFYEELLLAGGRYEFHL